MATIIRAKQRNLSRKKETSYFYRDTTWQCDHSLVQTFSKRRHRKETPLISEANLPINQKLSSIGCCKYMMKYLCRHQPPHAYMFSGFLLPFMGDARHVFHTFLFILVQPEVSLDSILRRSYTFRDAVDVLSSHRPFLPTITTCSNRQRESIKYTRSVQNSHKFRRTVDRVQLHKRLLREKSSWRYLVCLLWTKNMDALGRARGRGRANLFNLSSFALFFWLFSDLLWIV